MVLRKIEPYILAIGVMLCGTIQSYSAWDASVTIRHIVWLIVTVFLFMLVCYRKDFSQFKNPVLLCLVGYFLMVLVSGFQAHNKSEWIYEVCKAGVMCTFLFVCLTCIDRKIIAWAVTLLAVGLSIYGYVLLTHKTPANIKGLMGNKNPWSAALMLTIPFCIMTKWWLVLLPLGNVFFLFTRSALLAVGAMSMFGKRIRYFVIGIGIVAVVMNYNSITDAGSIKDRSEQWSASADMLRDNPFGVGAGNWKLEIPAYSSHFTGSDRQFATLLYTRPHNDFVWIGTETGPLGLLFFAGALIVGVVIACQKRDYVVAAGIVGYSVFAFFSFPLERVFHPVILCVLLALATRKVIPAVKCSSKTTIILVLVMSAFFAGSGYVFYQRHRCNCQSRTIRETKKDSKRLAALENISWFASIDRCTVPLHTYRAILRERAGDVGGAIDDMRLSIEANPNHAVSLVMLSICLRNVGLHEDGKYWYRRAKQISPKVDKVMLEALRKNKET